MHSNGNRNDHDTSNNSNNNNYNYKEGSSLAEAYGSSRRLGGWASSPPVTPYGDDAGGGSGGGWGDGQLEVKIADGARGIASSFGSLTSPKALYGLGSTTIEPLGHEDGGDPKVRREGRLAGYVMSTQGDYRQHQGRVPTVTQRTGVLFGSELRDDAKVRKNRGVKKKSFLFDSSLPADRNECMNA